MKLAGLGGECRSRRYVGAYILLRLWSNLSFTLCATLLPSGVRARDVAKNKQTQVIPLFGSLTPRCSTRYSVRDREIASCDTRNIVYACGPRLGAHPTGQMPRKAGIFHGARPSGEGLTGFRVCSIERACRYRNWSFFPGETARWWWRAHEESAHCKLDRNQPRRRLRSGHRLSPPIQPSTPTILSGKGEISTFAPNGIFLLCVDPLIPVEVWL